MHDEAESNNNTDKKLRRKAMSKRTGKCDRCPPHGGENCRIGRRPKPDKYKNKRD